MDTLLKIVFGIIAIGGFYYIIRALIYMSNKNARFPDSKEYESEIRDNTSDN